MWCKSSTLGSIIEKLTTDRMATERNHWLDGYWNEPLAGWPLK